MRWHNQPNSVWQEKEMTQSALAKTISAVRSAFRGYYFKPNMIETPDMIEQREFGYMQFGQVGMVRHLSFNSMKELIATIIKEAPADIIAQTRTTAFQHIRCRKSSGLEPT